LSAAAEIAQRVRLSDPRPSHCAACFRGAEEGVRFVDFDAAIDRGQRVVERDGAVWERESIDDLHVCDACVRQAAECLAIRPQASANQLREIRRLETENAGMREYIQRLEATHASRPATLTPNKRRGS
jgi:hypothetical protein